MALNTRPLTGKTSWPVLLLAGVEKTGKTYQAIKASASPMVGRTFLITVGEDIPEEYAGIEGSRAEVVPHDGTYRDILRAVVEASIEPRGKDGKPNLVILDSATRVWNLLSEAAQETANERARKKGRTVGVDGADVTVDLWNTATQRWNHILDALRDHDGPSIVTARLDEVTVMDSAGKPTKDKHWKVQGQKNLPYDVGAIVQLRAYGQAYITGVRSLKFRPAPGELTPMAPDWSVDSLWRALGLEDTKSIGDRPHAGIAPQGADAERLALLAQVGAAADAAGVSRQDVANTWAEQHAGQSISEATDLGGLELLRDDLAAKANLNQQGDAA